MKLNITGPTEFHCHVKVQLQSAWDLLWLHIVLFFSHSYSFHVTDSRMATFSIDATDLTESFTAISEFNFNRSTTVEPIDDNDNFAVILEKVSLSLSVFGFLANLGTLITLVTNGKTFSPKSRLLLQNQVRPLLVEQKGNS